MLRFSPFETQQYRLFERARAGPAAEMASIGGAAELGHNGAPFKELFERITGLALYFL